jgi:hypothetical protein
LAAILAAVALLAGWVIVLLGVEEMAAGHQEALAGIDMLCTVGADVRIVGHGVSLPHLGEPSLHGAEVLAANQLLGEGPRAM